MPEHAGIIGAGVKVVTNNGRVPAAAGGIAEIKGA